MAEYSVPILLEPAKDNLLQEEKLYRNARMHKAPGSHIPGVRATPYTYKMPVISNGCNLETVLFWIQELKRFFKALGRISPNQKLEIALQHADLIIMKEFQQCMDEVAQDRMERQSYLLPPPPTMQQNPIRTPQGQQQVPQNITVVTTERTNQEAEENVDEELGEQTQPQTHPVTPQRLFTPTVRQRMEDIDPSDFEPMGYVFSEMDVAVVWERFIMNYLCDSVE